MNLTSVFVFLVEAVVENSHKPVGLEAWTANDSSPLMPSVQNDIRHYLPAAPCAVGLGSDGMVKIMISKYLKNSCS
jgi:hypothetical protein